MVKKSVITLLAFLLLLQSFVFKTFANETILEPVIVNINSNLLTNNSTITVN